MPLNKAVFLDRDGVINVDCPDFAKSWDEFVFTEGIAGVLRALKKMGCLLVLVTNQSCVGRGIIGIEVVESIHAQMQAELEKQGAALDAVYVCPHAPNDGCSCRKPATGSFERAIRELQIDPAQSFMVGDAERDIIAGRRIGLKTILVRTGRAKNMDRWETKPDKIVESVRDLPAAIKELS
jgi:histidinol-phosphate phosphatase family protein